MATPKSWDQMTAISVVMWMTTPLGRLAPHWQRKLIEGGVGESIGNGPVTLNDYGWHYFDQFMASHGVLGIPRLDWQPDDDWRRAAANSNRTRKVSYLNDAL